MLRSLYIAGTGMLTMRRQLDVIANNITNADTTSYKSDKLLSRSFSDMLIERLDDPNIISRSTPIGEQNTGVHIDEIVTDHAQGILEETGKTTDLAIEGTGYFAVETPDGVRYTRDGAFTVNAEGYLATSGGHFVLNTAGARIQVNGSAFQVDEAGVVTAEGAQVGTLQLVSFEDTGALRKVGDNLYYNYGNSATTQGGGSVRQGVLETSNVDITREMVNLIQVSRRYETNQRMVQMLDESLGKAVNEVGRV